MAERLSFTLCLLLTLYQGIVTAKPLNPEDLESLLPPTPRDKNETIAAVVQDPVVQDAVHQAASNASLNGLVVKKKVYIMPIVNPDKVLSNSEQLFVVPTENLEDVRKNITDTKRIEAESVVSVSPETSSLFEGNTEDEYMPERTESGPEKYINEIQAFSEGNTEQSIPINEIRKTETKFLKDKLSRDAILPEDESKKVDVPIVAVIDPSNSEKGKVNSPIVAILPNQLNSDTLEKQVQFLKYNSENIQKQAQDYIDQTSLAVSPENWEALTPSEIAITPTQEAVAISLLDRDVSKVVPEGVFLTSVMMPQWEIVAPVFPNDVQFSRDTGDMDVAEDIIFRPLFRYRQESQQRSRYRDQDNRRYYRPYRGYYPNRNYYRNQYDDY